MAIFGVFLTCVLALILLIIVEPYRMQRMLTFLEPEKDPFGAGYQLMQSLIAFGQGQFSGLGLGNSIQKLQYLPEELIPTLLCPWLLKSLALLA